MSDGARAYDPVRVEHGQMPDAVVGHEPQTLLDGVIRGYMDDLTRKDFFDRRLLRGFPFKRHFASVIAFGENAYELVGLSNEQGTDVFVRHELNGVEHRRLWRD